ncbi:MAG: energy transducer TonB [Proteobacteria bacterium]|nr:energy transducer TonB [Pseudomonadota bacterium]
MDTILRALLFGPICAVLVLPCVSLAAPIASQSAALPECRSSTLTAPKALTTQTMGEETYPLISVALGEEGATILRVTIGTDGNVTDARVETSSGYPRLDDASLEGVKSWRYSPATLDGKPAACTKEMRIIWKLTGDVADEARATTNFISMSKADYPPGAYERNEQGTTLIFLLVDETGTVINGAMIRSSGFADLDSAAMNIAATRWKLEAAKLSGEKVKTIIPLMIVWSLTGSEH